MGIPENIYIDCQPVEEINGSTQDETQDEEINNLFLII